MVVAAAAATKTAATLMPMILAMVMMRVVPATLALKNDDTWA